MLLNQHTSTKIMKEKQNYVLLSLLKEKGMKQTNLADALGHDKAYVNRIIRGHQEPTIEIMIRIAKILNVDSRTIWREEKRKEHKTCEYL